MKIENKKIKLLKEIFTKPIYIVLVIIFSIIYYFIFFAVLKSSGTIYGLQIPNFLIYTIVILSAILLTIGVYSIKLRSQVKKGVSDSFISVAVPTIGGILSGCSGCTAPLLYSILIPIFGDLASVGIVLSISKYNIYIISILIIIELGFLYYQLYSLTKPQNLKSGKLDINK